VLEPVNLSSQNTNGLFPDGRRGEAALKNILPYVESEENGIWWGKRDKMKMALSAGERGSR